MTKNLTMLQISISLNYRVSKILYVHDIRLTGLMTENNLLI